ncbi:hypothetical protein [Ascidiimonas aurantiaca]|uniref:hypothetical protein n=1 Tax=Ascidiimonas aurantiaca TaxID=1685432 RepID=UPI0030ECC479
MKKDTISEAVAYEKKKLRFRTTDERIVASRKLRQFILDINEIYKRNKDASLMELMKRLTEKKRSVEKRLKGKPAV